MKENEDGFIPVEQCVEALLRPARFPIASHSDNFIDLRQTYACKLLKLVHGSHFRSKVEARARTRIVGSTAFRYALSSCEDRDELILALTAAKKLTT
jgi:hypothetical protein